MQQQEQQQQLKIRLTWCGRKPDPDSRQQPESEEEVFDAGCKSTQTDAQCAQNRTRKRNVPTIVSKMYLIKKINFPDFSENPIQ